MPKPVVLIAEQLAQSAMDVLGTEFEIRHVDGADRGALLPALKDADAILIRSATTMDAEALAAAPLLKVVARAGIGLDNVDVPAATARGVLVVNAPQSNIVTAAEHALALLLAVARKIPAADASLRAGEWKRSKFTGVEIADKTVGVVGLGRIGQLFAARVAAFGTTVIAYDPYLQPARAAALGVRLVDLPTLLATADIISIHLPRTPETLGLIGAAELATVKPGVLIVNAARGGLIDEQALADALIAGRVGGAGIDVYVKEPLAADSPLRTAPNTVLTPHLGASTAEAQDKAGTAVARSVKLALRGDFVPDAVNVQAAGPVSDELQPWIPLVSRLGTILTAVAGGVPSRVSVEVRGDLAAQDTSILQLAAVRGHLRRRHHRGRHLRQRAGAGRRARADADQHLHRGDRRLPVGGHPAGRDGRRRVPHGVRHAVRRAAGRQADRDQQPALRPARRGQPAGGRLRGPARRDGHRRRAARPGSRSTSRPRRSPRNWTAARRSWCCGWTGYRPRNCWTGSARSSRPVPFGGSLRAEASPAPGSAPGPIP